MVFTYYNTELTIAILIILKKANYWQLLLNRVSKITKYIKAKPVQY